MSEYNDNKELLEQRIETILREVDYTQEWRYSEPGPYGGISDITMTAGEIISFQMSRKDAQYENEQHALDDFIVVNWCNKAEKTYTEAEHEKIVQDTVQEKLRQQREACVLSIKRNHSWQELKSAIRNAKIDD